MKQFIFALIFILAVSNSAFSQTCVKVDSVYSTMKIKEFKNRSILFGVKQITEEAISEKYSLCDSNATSVKVNVKFIGTPSSSFRIAGIGEATQITQIKINLYFGDKVVEGIGESETSASYAFLQLTDDKIPFDKTTIGISIKKAIVDAISKL
jgi:hypothetical protein